MAESVQPSPPPSQPVCRPPPPRRERPFDEDDIRTLAQGQTPVQVNVATAERSPGSPGTPGWLRLAWVYGFTLVFAVVALCYGLWFGVQLMGTQRGGVEAINRIQDVEAIQVKQLAGIDERLERLERAAGTGP